MKKRISMTWISGLALVFFAASAAVGLAQSNTPVTSPSPKTGKDAAVQPQPKPDLVIPVTIGPPDIRSAANSRNPAKPPEFHLSAWTTEVIKMAHAGIDQQVLLTYIDNTPGTFNLGADQIIYLTEQGISSDAITEMLQHDADVASGVLPVTASTVPLSPSAVHITFVPAAAASAKTSGQPAANPTPAVTTAKAGALPPQSESPPDLGPAPDTAVNSTWQYPEVDEFNVVPAAMPAKASGSQEKTTYPVREPYPVAITAPIIVIRAPGLAPNTVIIDFEP